MSPKRALIDIRQHNENDIWIENKNLGLEPVLKLFT